MAALLLELGEYRACAEALAGNRTYRADARSGKYDCRLASSAQPIAGLAADTLAFRGEDREWEESRDT
jgi:hypothetical protein